LGRIFNADALERAVLDVLSEVLRDWPELEARLLAHAQSQITAADQGSEMVRVKEQQRQEVRDQLLLYVRQLTPKTQADLQDEIKRLEAQRDALDAEIEMLKRHRSTGDIDPAVVVEGMKRRLLCLADEIPNLSPLVLADVLSAFTAVMEADMETKETTFAFRLPSWILMDDSETSIAQLCSRTSRESSVGSYTHHDPSLFIPVAEGRCGFVQHQRSVSCHCRRTDRRAAA
jgi:hypothetical protein